MRFLKQTRSKIALAIIFSVIVLGMIEYIIREGTEKYSFSNNQQASPQVTSISSITPSISKLPPPCSARDLRATVSWDAAMGTVLGEIYYTNVSSSPCSLRGFSTVQLKDERGFLYHTQVTNYTDLYHPYDTKKPITVVLRPNTDIAYTSFTWRGCVPDPHKSILVYVTLPLDTSQLLAQDFLGDTPTKQVDTPKCSDNQTPTNQSVMEVGSFEEVQ